MYVSVNIISTWMILGLYGLFGGYRGPFAVELASSEQGAAIHLM